MAWKIAVAVYMMAALFFTPAKTDFATYLKFGQHAAQMQTWKSSTKAYINSLKTLANYLESDTNALNVSLQMAQNMMEEQVNSMDTMTDNLLDRLEDIQNNVTSLNASYEAPLAFQAFVVAAGTSMMAMSSVTIKYGNVALNDGGHYNPTTGLFTAPEPGLYWFHATLTVPGSDAEVVFKKIKASGGTESIAYLMYYISQETSCTTVTLMYPGDTMGIYPKSSTFDTWQIAGGYGNTFAGYLVARYDDPDYVPAATNAAPAAATTAAATDAAATEAPAAATTEAPIPAPSTSASP